MRPCPTFCPLHNRFRCLHHPISLSVIGPSVIPILCVWSHSLCSTAPPPVDIFEFAFLRERNTAHVCFLQIGARRCDACVACKTVSHESFCSDPLVLGMFLAHLTHTDAACCQARPGHGQPTTVCDSCTHNHNAPKVLFRLSPVVQFLSCSSYAVTCLLLLLELPQSKVP